MTAAALIHEVRLLGVEVYVVGDRVRLQPARRLSPELIETLRARKAELLEVLLLEQGVAGVGPWQPTGGDRYCPSCGGGLRPGDTDGEPCFTCRWPGMPARPQ